MADDSSTVLLGCIADYMAGVREIDDDHGRLFALAQGMHRAMLDGKSKAILEELLSRLLDYTDYHFTHEERLMARTGYPGLGQHQQEHENLRSRVRAMQHRAASGEVTMTIEVMLFLMEWLKRHTAASDRLIVEHLEATGVPAGLVRF